MRYDRQSPKPDVYQDMTIRRVAPPPDSLRGYAAGFVTRYIAFLIDVALIAAVAFLVVTTTRLTLTFFGLDRLLGLVRDSVTWLTDASALGVVLRWVVTVAGGFLTFSVYSVLSWLLVGKTVGKAVMGLRVVGQDGRRLTLRQAIIRSLGYYASALPLFVGFLSVLVDDRRQAWHDRLAKTIVVYEWDAQYEERLVNAVRQLSDSNERRQAALEQAVRLAAEGDEPPEADHG